MPPVATALVLVNGLPGAGKTMLADALGARWGVPVLSKDRVKELLADLAFPALPSGRLGALAMDTVWATAAALDGTVIVESVWFTGRDEELLSAGVARSGAATALELWCDVPTDVAAARFDARAPGRHPVHGREPAAAQPWWPTAGSAGPLHPTHLVVDTTAPVDVEALARAVSRLLAG
jgi:predicted kinase